MVFILLVWILHAQEGGKVRGGKKQLLKSWELFSSIWCCLVCCTHLEHYRYRLHVKYFLLLTSNHCDNKRLEIVGLLSSCNFEKLALCSVKCKNTDFQSMLWFHKNATKPHAFVQELNSVILSSEFWSAQWYLSCSALSLQTQQWCIKQGVLKENILFFYNHDLQYRGLALSIKH